jgi:hypothetical protein
MMQAMEPMQAEHQMFFAWRHACGRQLAPDMLPGMTKTKLIDLKEI